jgi:hypothetical protein
MIEDAAIRIVFTLRGLYTWTHWNGSQPGISQLDDETLVFLKQKLLASVPSGFPGLGRILPQEVASGL